MDQGRRRRSCILALEVALSQTLESSQMPALLGSRVLLGGMHTCGFRTVSH